MATIGTKFVSPRRNVELDLLAFRREKQTAVVPAMQVHAGPFDRPLELLEVGADQTPGDVAGRHERDRQRPLDVGNGDFLKGGQLSPLVQRVQQQPRFRPRFEPQADVTRFVRLAPRDGKRPSRFVVRITRSVCATKAPATGLPLPSTRRMASVMGPLAGAGDRARPPVRSWNRPAACRARLPGLQCGRMARRQAPKTERRRQSRTTNTEAGCCA